MASYSPKGWGDVVGVVVARRAQKRPGVPDLPGDIDIQACCRQAKALGRVLTGDPGAVLVSSQVAELQSLGRRVDTVLRLRTHAPPVSQGEIETLEVGCPV